MIFQKEVDWTKSSHHITSLMSRPHSAGNLGKKISMVLEWKSLCLNRRILFVFKKSYQQRFYILPFMELDALDCDTKALTFTLACLVSVSGVCRHVQTHYILARALAQFIPGQTNGRE